MKKNSLIVFFATILFLLVSNSIYSQDNLLYNMSHVPQINNTNPAKNPSCKAFVGFPALSSLYFDINNTGFVYKDIFKQMPTELDSFMIDLDKIENALESKNYLTFDYKYSLINFGFRIKQEWYFTFGISTNINEQFMFPRDYVSLRRGNYSETGIPLNLGIKENLSIYHEFAAGLSKKFYNGLTLGVKIKYLSGLANLQSNKLNLSWATSTADTAIYDWNFDTDFDIRSSVPVGWGFTRDSSNFIDGAEITEFDPDSSAQVEKFLNENRNSFLFTNNRGFGIDIGFDYKIDNQFSVSGSIIDLGFIKWKDNAKTLTQSGQFVVSGIDMAKYYGDYNSVVNAGTTTWLDSLTDDISDSLKQFINPKESSAAYKTALQTKIYLGANYAPTKWFDMGLLYRGYFLDKKLYNVWTVSANANFLKAWSLSASWSRWNKMNNNIGLGLAYKIGPVQMYFLSDNIAVPFWAANESSLSDRWIRNTKKVSFHFGINLLFCREKQDIGLID